MSRILLIFLITACAMPALAQETASPVGTSEWGRLINAVALPLESPAHLKISRVRQRWWGTRTLVDFILGVAEALQTESSPPQRLIVGDLSGRRGGDISLHRSHENGLDVDLGYPTLSGAEQDADGDHSFLHAMVDRLSGRISTDFNLEASWALVRAAVRSHLVQRIFLAPEIKRLFCQHATERGELETEAETLWRLTPLRNHHDHLHVRLYCPAGATHCRNMPDPAPHLGCDED